jgi:hypothetical protein
LCGVETSWTSSVGSARDYRNLIGKVGEVLQDVVVSSAFLSLGNEKLTDEYSVQSRRGLCVKTGQLRVELIILKVV